MVRPADQRQRRDRRRVGDLCDIQHELPLQPRAGSCLALGKGKAIDLGNLGGQTGEAGGNIALDINNQGQVVGNSDLPGDTTFHAFLWTKRTGMQDLGTLSGDVASLSISINDAGSVIRRPWTRTSTRGRFCGRRA